ncbi:MAG TPA: NmrA family NAD(P)-binding protein [Pedobacter sp.]|nr:NmrA family NAD(P)-binding protein [Pedobacter sp.]
MNIILGGTGHIGSVVAKELIRQGQPVTIVTQHPDKASELQAEGASIACLDVTGKVALHKLLLSGERLFLLNPPALPSTDTVKEERTTLQAILTALKGSGINHVVAASTYGARPGEGQGDFNVLYEMEEALYEMPLTCSIIRSAYYMSNWDGYLEGAKAGGVLPSFFPVDFELPMVAPEDIGKFAASLMIEEAAVNSLHHLEGPKRYTPNDVASAFSGALGEGVTALEILEEEWNEKFRSVGFSDEAADSYHQMTKATIEGNFNNLDGHVLGNTTIQQYVQGLVANKYIQINAADKTALSISDTKYRIFLNLHSIKSNKKTN